MSACIIFLDIDGTLIDVDQKPNTDELPSCIAELQKKGVRFGLNSNRALEDIRLVAAAFGLNGPFILEGGAYFLETLDGTPHSLSKNTIDVPAITEQALKKIIPDLFSGADLMKIDTTRLIIENKFKAGKHFYQNEFRKFSASIHHRFDGGAHFEVAKQLARALQTSFDEEKVPLNAAAHTHGATVTVGMVGVTKGQGIKAVRELHPNAQIVAIGDGADELSLRRYVDRLYAVANAIPELKQVADAVSQEPMTRGVVELLKTTLPPS